MYDIIGDIHGYADKLQALLANLGYENRSGLWVPPAGRQAIFLGDLIDRGPEQVKVVDIVRRMQAAGYAQCILGNHEFNALGYATPVPGESNAFARPHTPSKVAQHADFLRQVGEGSALHLDMLSWFRTLKPALDLGGLRVVHAWWHPPYVELVNDALGDGIMDAAFVLEAFDKSTALYAAMEGLTKGQEIRLPKGHSFEDHTGEKRKKVRTRWWLRDATCYSEVSIVPEDQEHGVPVHPLDESFVRGEAPDKPIFVGHYWFKGRPAVQTDKVAVLDWSAAGDGPVVAYRWDGESVLSNEKFVTS